MERKRIQCLIHFIFPKSLHVRDSGTLRQISDSIKHVFAEMEIPDSFIPNEFTTVEENEESCHAGTLWLKSKKTVAIKVPSIILPSEYDRDFNIILNPEHPYFHLLKIKTVVECPFDLRLF